MSKNFDHRTHFGEVTIEARGKKGIYSVSFTDEGRHIRRSLQTSNRKVAIAKVESVLAEYFSSEEIGLSRDAVEQISSGNSLLLADGLRLYLEYLKGNGSPRKTIEQVALRVNWFIEHVGRRGVTFCNEVKPIDGDSLFRTRRKLNHNNTAVGYFRFVKSMFAYLKSRQLVDSNPFAEISFKRIPHTRTPKPVLEQVDIILDKLGPQYKTEIASLAMLGCRVEALTLLGKKQVDLKRGLIEFEKPKKVNSKTVARIVPIHARLLKMLRQYSRPRSPYFFSTIRSTRSKGGGKLKSENINAAFKDACRNAGYPAGRKDDGFVIHSLRGFFKSHCIMQGIPREVVDIWQGHASDDSIGTRHYFELPIEKSIEFMNKVDFGS
jgi:integrase